MKKLFKTKKLKVKETGRYTITVEDQQHFEMMGYKTRLVK